ncbi:MAG: hypothetical protein V1724_10440 [Chloroflexota bacterium]
MGVSSIVAGQELGQVQFNLDASLVREYLSVAGDRSEVYAGTDLVPYTAVAALGVRTVLRGLALPPGTVHVAQELVAHRAVACGQSVSCRAKVTQASHRRDGTFLVIEFAVNDDAGQPVLDGRITLLVPGQGK